MTGPVADLRSQRRARVLVVEEDPRHAEALSRVLDAAGFHVAVVRSPALALRCMRDEQVAVVVLSNSVRGIAATTAMVSRLRARPEPQFHDAGIVAIVDDQVDAAFGLGEDADVVLIRPGNRWANDSSPMQFQSKHLRGLAAAGRLDIDSTGLLVFTQDGRVAKQLIGEHSKTDKEYLVRVRGNLVQNGLALLNHGLSLDGEALKPAKVTWQNEDQLRFILRQGKKRQIRRMCELVGLRVVGLKRRRLRSVTSRLAWPSIARE